MKHPHPQSTNEMKHQSGNCGWQLSYSYRGMCGYAWVNTHTYHPRGLCRQGVCRQGVRRQGREAGENFV